MASRNMDYDLAGRVIGCAMRVHAQLGAGFLESVYQGALAIELENQGIKYVREYPITVYYDKQPVGQFYADFFVEEELVVELKSIHNLATAHEVQLVNYLSATHIDVGLLLNFGSESLQFKRRQRKLQASLIQ